MTNHADDQYLVVDRDDGTIVGFEDYQDDIFDDEDENVVFRRVSFYDDYVLDPGYGQAIDRILLGHRELLENGEVTDREPTEATLTVGDLRRLNVIAGLLQGELRVRNPEFEFLRKKK